MAELTMLLLILAIVGSAALYARRSRGLQEARATAELEPVRRTADEDVTRFGEELQRLDVDVTGRELDEATRQDYQRALDSYEAAKTAIDAIQSPDDIRHVSATLEDGRYAVACVRARLAGEALPVRRAPCFFNPQHGPSTEEVEWAPPGGVPREVPACAADAERVRAGAEPDVRTVMVGPQRVPYWDAGPAYSPWVMGYFGAYAAAGMLPAFMIGSLMGGAFTGWGGSEGFDTAYDQGFDHGFDAGQDSGDAGGYDGGDYGGGGWDSGGDFAGGFDGF